MKRKRFRKFVQLLKQVARLLLLLLVVDGIVTLPVFATQTERSPAAAENGFQPEIRSFGSAMVRYSSTLFQSPLPTPTFTPTPPPPTDTPTPPPPTDTPTPVSNQPPEITNISVPSDPVHIDQQPVIVDGTFTDPDAGDTHRAEWLWGDSTASSCPPNDVDCAIDQNQDVVSGKHSYAEPGVYRTSLTVTDQEGLSDTEESDLIVVYDSDGGFVTGGGWIYSEAGWCKLDHCTTAEGRATFGFVSKYKKGATAPGGHTTFIFEAGNLNFRSDSYQWMVVTQGGNRAQFKGSGTINGALAPGNVPYHFMLWAGDDNPDTFRIKISFETPPTEVVVYDPGAGQPLGEGSIVIHAGE